MNSTSLAPTMTATPTSEQDPVARNPVTSGDTVTDTAKALFWEGTSKVASTLDAIISLPEVAGDWINKLHIPIVSDFAPTVGRCLSRFGSVFVHSPSCGALKWLQGLRLWNGVETGVKDSLNGLEDLGSLKVESFLAGVSDKGLRQDLKDYFVELSNSRTTAQSGDGSESAQSEATNKLAALELRIGQRAELVELKMLANAEENGRKASLSELERTADRLASLMITRVEEAYKSRLGWFGAEMEGSWVQLSARGEDGRAELRRRIRDRLMQAYEGEDMGTAASKEGISAIKEELHNAFRSKSTMKNALSWTVIGALYYSGAVGEVWRLLGEGAGFLAGMLKDAVASVAPSWLSEGVDKTLAYASALATSLSALLGIKSLAGMGLSDIPTDLGQHDAGGLTPEARVNIDVATNELEYARRGVGELPDTTTGLSGGSETIAKDLSTLGSNSGNAAQVRPVGMHESMKAALETRIKPVVK